MNVDIEALHRRIRELEQQLQSICDSHRIVNPRQVKCVRCNCFASICSFRYCDNCNSEVCHRCARECVQCRGQILCPGCWHLCSVCDKAQCSAANDVEEGHCWSCLRHTQQRKITYFALELLVGPMVLERLLEEIDSAWDFTRCVKCDRTGPRLGNYDPLQKCPQCGLKDFNSLAAYQKELQ